MRAVEAGLEGCRGSRKGGAKEERDEMGRETIGLGTKADMVGDEARWGRTGWGGTEVGRARGCTSKR